MVCGRSGLGDDSVLFYCVAILRGVFGSVTLMGLEERSCPIATYLEIYTCFSSHPVISALKCGVAFCRQGTIEVELEIDLIHLCG